MAKRKGKKAKEERKKRVNQRKVAEQNRTKVYVGVFANLMQKWCA